MIAILSAWPTSEAHCMELPPAATALCRSADDGTPPPAGLRTFGRGSRHRRVWVWVPVSCPDDVSTSRVETGYWDDQSEDSNSTPPTPSQSPAKSEEKKLRDPEKCKDCQILIGALVEARNKLLATLKDIQRAVTAASSDVADHPVHRDHEEPSGRQDVLPRLRHGDSREVHLTGLGLGHPADSQDLTTMVMAALPEPRESQEEVSEFNEGEYEDRLQAEYQREYQEWLEVQLIHRGEEDPELYQRECRERDLSRSDVHDINSSSRPSSVGSFSRGRGCCRDLRQTYVKLASICDHMFDVVRADARRAQQNNGVPHGLAEPGASRGVA